MIKKNAFCLLFTSVLLFISCSKDEPQEKVVPIIIETRNMSFTIAENPTENQLIGTMEGTTNKGSVLFSVIEQTPVGAFRIDSGTGELFVDNASIYDYETSTNITGKVKVANGNVSKESNVLIAITDIDEDIYVGDAVLTSQEEVDAFGLNNYREITGFLSIGDSEEEGGSPITDLSGLSSLEKIGGSISIVRTNVLTTLKGLDNIVSANECTILSNLNLKDVSALQNISSLNFLRISSNPKLVSLDTFPNIPSLENGCRITSNDNLIEVTGLSNLESVGSLTILQNQNLNNISGLTALATINGELLISGNSSLVNLIGLNNLETILGRVQITGNDKLFDINSIQNLTFVQDEIYINYNMNLQHVDGLNGLKTVKGLTLYFNDSLQHLEGLSNLESVEDRLVIGENSSLDDFCGLITLVNNDNSFTYSVVGNLFNPTVEDILNQNCSN